MRFRLTVTAVRAYDVDPANYLQTSVEAMLQADKEAAINHRNVMLNHPDTNWDVQVEDITSACQQCCRPWIENEPHCPRCNTPRTTL